MRVQFGIYFRFDKMSFLRIFNFGLKFEPDGVLPNFSYIDVEFYKESVKNKFLRIGSEMSSSYMPYWNMTPFEN